MGERRSDGGLAGRGSRHTLLEADVEALIVACLVRDGVDAEAEQRAVAAFRAARDAGTAHRHVRRRRDDWSPGGPRLLGRSLRTTLSVLLASLTLGGVAVAAIGVAGGSADGPDDTPERPPSSSAAPRDPAPDPPRTPRTPHPGDGSAPAGRAPGRETAGTGKGGNAADARDIEAHCRAYERAGGSGRAMESTALKRLIDAAGGERNVTAYCAARKSGAEPGRSDAPATKRPGAQGSPAAGEGSDGKAGGAAGQGADKGRSDGKRSPSNGRRL
ncbi:hypothetical protein ACH4C6_03895 [Streptomyces sp. NPDC017943]|uniref:hypothetical protein n=1 Tax=Streptomyces sp. NPDC017943 TaxID=3365019 RepID=UPI003787B6CC